MSGGSNIPTDGPWPYLTRDNYIDVVPEYTKKLASVLKTAPAQVAQAVTAAAQATAAAAAVPRVAAGEVANQAVTGAFRKVYVRFPDGRFTAKPSVTVSGTGSGSGGTNQAVFHVGGVSSRGCDIWVWAVPGQTLQGSWTGFMWQAIQVG